MKKNYFLAFAVAALMFATTVAQAADVSFSGQIRPRYNVNNDYLDNTNADKFFDTRVRLNAKAKVNANTIVDLQFQSVGQWGTDGADTGTRTQIGGSGPQFQASDTLADVGLHQATLTLKNFGGHAVDAKIGRQEIILDGHRLFGHTGWTQGAATQDAIRLTHAGGNHTVQYIYMENLNAGDSTAHSNADYATHTLHTSVQGVLGGSLSGYLVYVDDDAAKTQAGGTAVVDDGQDWFTIGARQKGKLAGLDYRVEYYYQFGDGQIPANDLNAGIAAAYTGLNDTASIDREASMFGVRVGKTFKNAKMSPTFTLWYDRLSGTDDDDITAGDFGGFDTLYDTGHKFYGFMDQYLNSTNLGTGGMGLQDIAIKLKMSPKDGWTAKADMHWFMTETDMDGANGTIVAANTALLDATSVSNDLGSELDLTLAHKYDANTKIQAGYSHYWSTQTFAMLNEGALGSNHGSDWFYVQVDTKF